LDAEIVSGGLVAGQKPHIRKAGRSAPVETIGMQKPDKKRA